MVKSAFIVALVVFRDRVNLFPTRQLDTRHLESGVRGGGEVAPPPLSLARKTDRTANLANVVI